MPDAERREEANEYAEMDAMGMVAISDATMQPEG